MSVQLEKERGGNPVWDFAVRWQAVVVPAVGVLLAFAIGAVLISLQGVNPIYAYSSLFNGALVREDGLLRTLQKATPLIFAGMAVTIAFRVGLFNIGAQGQLVSGGIVTAWAGISLSGQPGVVVLLGCVAAGTLAGAAWASIAAFLKAYRNVHEVISTIMLNSIAAILIDYMVGGPLKEPGQSIPRTAQVPEGAWLPNLGPVPVGFLLAVSMAFGMSWMLMRTTTGFRFNTVGANKFAAVYAGIGLRKTIMLSMLISGAFAGLGGAIETVGVTHRYEAGFNAGLGFDGITIALLARANPIATIPAALLVGVMRAGAATLQFNTGIQPEVVDLILAIVLLLVSIPVLAKAIFRDRVQATSAVTAGWGS